MKFKIIFVSLLVFFLFQSYNSADLKDITSKEIQDLGNGAALYFNIKSNNQDRFAILFPPLPGILTFFSSSYFIDRYDIHLVPSGNYSDMVSYMYTVNLAYKVGESIIQNIHKDEIHKLKLSIRLKNIIGMLGIFLTLIIYEQYLLSGFLVLFFTFNNDFITSISQVLCSFFVIVTVILMSSILNRRSNLKFLCLGILCGLTIITSGVNGLILHGIGICSTLISYDLKHKHISKGFKKAWCVGMLIYCISTLFIVWSGYGFYLAKFNEVVMMFGASSTLSINAVPFYDTIKQSIFEMIFEGELYQCSLEGNISVIWKSSLLSLFTLILNFRQIKHNVIFVICIFFAAIFFQGQNSDRVMSFLQTVSIMLPTASVLAVTELNRTKILSIKNKNNI